MTEKQLMVPDLEKVKALEIVSRMDLLLEEADDWDSMMNVRNGSLGIAALAGAMRMGEVAQKAKVVQMKAERKAGEWLSENITRGGDMRAKSMASTSLDDLGISRDSSAKWQRIASVPERIFLRWVDGCLKDDEEITRSAFLRFIKPAGPKPEPEKPKSLLDRWAEKLKELSGLLYEIGAYRNAKEAKLHLSYAVSAAATVATMLADIKALVNDLEKASREG